MTKPRRLALVLSLRCRHVSSPLVSGTDAMTQRHATNNAIWTDDDDGLNRGSAVDTPVANATELFAAFAVLHAPSYSLHCQHLRHPVIIQLQASRKTDSTFWIISRRTRLQRFCTYTGSATRAEPQQSGLNLRLVDLELRYPSLSTPLQWPCSTFFHDAKV
jgi:hypothetical protein